MLKRRNVGGSLKFLIEAVENLERRTPPAAAESQNEKLAALIRLCGDCRALPQGKRVHACLLKHGYGGERFLSNLLIDMYGKCGSLQDARSVFREMKQRNRYSWAIIMNAYTINGWGWEVIQLFREMDQDGTRPDNVNFVNMLTAIASVGALQQGKAVHARISALGMLHDDVLFCSLIAMYGRCGAIEEARDVFDSKPGRDPVTWNAMLAAFSQNGRFAEAMSLYREFCVQEIPHNNITYITMLYVCSCLEDLEEGTRIHSVLSQEMIDNDVVLANALATMYYKCQRLELAEEIFERMPVKSSSSWTAMITASAQSGQPRNALQFYRRMHQDGVEPVEITFMSVLDACCLLRDIREGRRNHEWIAGKGLDKQVLLGTNLVNMYGKCGSVADARDVFRRLERKTLVTWTAMIAAYAQNGCSREALELFYEFEEEEGKKNPGFGLKLDNIALITVVDACTKVGDLNEGRRLHQLITKHKLENDLVVCNALITMYNKCGSLAAAKAMFDGIERDRNVISWNAMIAAYCEHALNEAAVELFARMLNDGVAPDDVTFVSILFACSHAGLFKRGWDTFQSMQRDFSVVTKFEHYLCMTDLLGRAGKLDEAEVLLDGIPHRSSATAWNTLLSACKLHQNLDKGEEIAERIFELNPQAASSYVLLSGMFSAVGRFADAARVRRRMEENCGMATRQIKFDDDSF